MNFLLVKGKDFEEFFEFKNTQGKPIAMPSGVFKLILERGSFAREYTVLNNGLSRMMNKITWRIPAAQSQDFDFSAMYYTLYLDDRELARGVLRVQ